VEQINLTYVRLKDYSTYCILLGLCLEHTCFIIAANVDGLISCGLNWYSVADYCWQIMGRCRVLCW